MSDSIKFGKRNVTYPKGFKASACHAGIKRYSKKNDLALLVSETPAKAALVNTKNFFRAAPVLLNEKILKKQDSCSAIIVNSGNANAGTGSLGLKHAHLIGDNLAEVFAVGESNIFTFSTGSIGMALPAEKIIKKILFLKNQLSKNGGKDFSNAILTTDAFEKTASAEISYKGEKIRIGASCKGAGMIAPSMATMLCFITTDALISKVFLRKLLHDAVEKSFNRISVDGDMSTNDSVIMLANGESSVSVSDQDKDLKKLFVKALNKITSDLAEEIVRDGEGASKVMHIRVHEAKLRKEAVILAKALSNSPLLKCAVFGEVPNWGRILSTVGSQNVSINENKFRLFLQGHLCFAKGEPDFKAVKTLKMAMRRKKVEIDIYLGAGEYEYDMKASDFGFEYVEINRV